MVTGLHGIEHEIEPSEPTVGNSLERPVPEANRSSESYRVGIERFRNSREARELFGDEICAATRDYQDREFWGRVTDAISIVFRDGLNKFQASHDRHDQHGPITTHLPSMVGRWFDNFGLPGATRIYIVPPIPHTPGFESARIFATNRFPTFNLSWIEHGGGSRVFL